MNKKQVEQARKLQEKRIQTEKKIEAARAAAEAALQK